MFQLCGIQSLQLDRKGQKCEKSGKNSPNKQNKDLSQFKYPSCAECQKIDRRRVLIKFPSYSTSYIYVTPVVKSPSPTPSLNVWLVNGRHIVESK